MSDRYAFQEQLSFWGEEKQALLAQKKVAILGCGALGSNQAELLVRLGVKNLTIIDFDQVNLSNLHRVTMYNEQDIGIAKVKAAACHLQEIDSTVVVNAKEIKGTLENLPSLLAGADLLIDAADNMTVRAAMNKVCFQLKLPWIYGGVLGTNGMVMPILPGQSACLNCLLPNLAANFEPPTTRQLGVFPLLPRMMAIYQVRYALKYFFGELPAQPELFTFDIWSGEQRTLPVKRQKECPTCGKDGHS